MIQVTILTTDGTTIFPSASYCPETGVIKSRTSPSVKCGESTRVRVRDIAESLEFTATLRTIWHIPFQQVIAYLFNNKPYQPGFDYTLENCGPKRNTQN